MEGVAKDWTFKNIAAIDIGSNALRLLITSIYSHDPKATKTVQYLRLPLRLGDHAFLEKKIPNDKIDDFAQAMLAYRIVMKNYNVVSYRAVATSAMRESENRNEVLKRTKEVSGIEIEVISGEREAELIYNAHFQLFNREKKILFVDVGGGSTEITLFEDGMKVASRSFKLGTVRILDAQDDESIWADMKSWLKRDIAHHDVEYILGSGGNITKMLSLMGIETGKTCSRSRLKSAYKRILSYSYKDRIKKLKLNPDRADVIIPATEVFLSVMKAAKVNRVATAGVGLRDGIVHELRTEIMAKETVQL